MAKVPASLLLDPHLPASTKLLWLLRTQVGPSTISGLSRLSGLSRPTVQQSLRQLGALSAPPPEPQVVMPPELLTYRQLAVQARLLYASLQLTPRFQKNEGHVTYSELHRLTHLNVGTLRSALHQLTEQGWLELMQENKFKPIHFTLCNPITARRETEVLLAQLRLEESEYRGEALMRELLSLAIHSDEFEDDASPGFLVNPITEERLQLDRYYPPGVAWEYNGPQHYRTTKRFPNERKLRMQQTRDLIKIGLCQQRGIQLLILHADELSLSAIQERAAGLLPLRNLAEHGPLVAFLEKECRAHRRWAAEAGLKR